MATKVNLEELAQALEKAGYKTFLGETADKVRYLYLDDLKHIEVVVWEDGEVRVDDRPLDVGLIVTIARYWATN